MSTTALVPLPSQPASGAAVDEADEFLPDATALLDPKVSFRRPAGFPSPAAPAAPLDKPAEGQEQDALPKDLEQLARTIMKQHTERARVSSAVATAKQYATQHGLEWETLSAQLLPLGVDVQKLSRTLGHMKQGLTECSSDNGWTLVADGDLRLLYQHQPGTHVHSFKGSACLDAPVEQPLCLAREFDLINTWNRYMEETVILKEGGAAELWVYCVVWLPWPFASRDMVIHAQGMDLLDEEGCIAIAFEACDDNLPEGVTLPAAAAKRERIKVLPGSVLKLEPVPATGKFTANGHRHMTRGTAVTHIDANVPYVPSPIIQFVLRVFAPFMYHQVLRIIKKKFQEVDGPLPSRMRERPELYRMMADQVALFLAAAP